jgi:hypothetical protein
MTQRGKHNHIYTEAEKEIIRVNYKGTEESLQAIANRISASSGDNITPKGIKGQVNSLGLGRAYSDWTPEEEQTLQKMITTDHPRSIAKRLHRSINSVIVRSNRLHLSRSVRDGWFTEKEVCEILGVDHHWVEKQVGLKRLKMAAHNPEVKPCKAGGSYWHIKSEDLVSFIRSNALELQGRNVDLFVIVDLLAGVKTEVENGQEKATQPEPS